MKTDEIERKMIVHKHYDVTRAETEYIWSFGVHHVADKYNGSMGDEAAWREKARARAAALIARMVEQR
jgi:hypothetical protein